MTGPEHMSGDDLLAPLQAVPGAVWRSYLAPGPRVWYMALNKNACTSLKWMTADLAGEDLSTFRAGWSAFVDDAEAIHDRTLWKLSPRLSDLTGEERAAIRPDNGWFIFAVIRDPRLRLFSAWQNKLLIETPHSQRWAREDWYPRHPLNAETVVEDFARFVDLLERNPDHWLRAKDPHFRDQTEMLVEDAVPYSRIYDMGEMRQLREDLVKHLVEQGWSGELYLPRSNPTPLRAVEAVFADGVREQIERIYAADFERFGELWTDFSGVEKAEPWTANDLAGCEQQAVLGRRIAHLHRMARNQRTRATDAEKRAVKAERRVARLRRRNKGLQDRLTAAETGRGSVVARIRRRMFRSPTSARP